MRSHFIILAVFAAALLPGCVDQPAEPQSRGATSAPQMAALPDAGDFMPLASGNHWTYDRTFSTIVVPEDGPPPPPELIEEQVFLDHIEQRVIGERTYILEREVYSSESGANERLLRQDRAGYYTLERTKDDGKVAARPVLSGAQRNLVHRIAARYGADPASVQSHLTRIETVERMLRGLHAAPPGGPDPGEIQTLAYPLHPGATWMIRPAPFFSATVEGRERVAGFSSWRVRIDNEFLNENDTVYLWYSRCGQVAWRFHFESIATDPQGNVIGSFVSDDILRLVDTRLERGGCDVEPDVDHGGGVGGVVRSYPFTVGNRWTYTITTMLDGEPAGSDVVDEVQEQWVDIEGHTYMKQVLQPRGPMPWVSVHYMRQDRDGLYRLEQPGPAPAPRHRLHDLLGPAAAGPVANEAIILPYPLRVGESWTVRDTPELGLWTATVEARERVVSPAGEFRAFRIRIRHDFHNPGDETVLWYAPEGMVKAFQHVQTTEGAIDESWELTELDLN